MTLVERVRPAAGEPEGALVLLHGRGADENDLHGLLDQLDPAAPAGRRDAARRRCRCRPAARTGTPSTASASPIRTPSGRRSSELCAWYDALPERLGFPADRIVLGGFSQGCVMSYALGLAAGRPAPRALLAMSGFMPVVEGLELDLDRPGSRDRDRARRRRPRDRRRLRPRGPRPARRHAGPPRLPGVRRRPLGRPRRPGTAARRDRRRTRLSLDPSTARSADRIQADTIPACDPSPPSSTRTCRARGRRPTRPRSRWPVGGHRPPARRRCGRSTSRRWATCSRRCRSGSTTSRRCSRCRCSARATTPRCWSPSRASPSGPPRGRGPADHPGPRVRLPTAASRRCRGSTSATCCARSSPACCCWCGARCARASRARPRSR